MDICHFPLYQQWEDPKVIKLRYNAAVRTISILTYAISANSLIVSRILPNFTMKLSINAMLAIYGLVTTNLLNVSNIYNLIF